MNGFANLGLSDVVLQALEKKGFTEPTPIQARTIPLLLEGAKDVIGQARTGTGKTAAFGLPMIELCEEGRRAVQGLVLTPTRELAIQVAEELQSLRGDKRLSVVSVYGGQPIGPQLGELRRGADIVVGTPGRVMDHMERGSLRLDELSFFVLDEADEMCNMGFVDDVRSILERANTDRRTMLFSATMPEEIRRIATEFMREHELVRVASKEEKTAIRQIFHTIPEPERFEALCRVIDAEPEFYGLVFCRTKADCDRAAAKLAERGYPAEPIHGDLSQARREEILGRFRSRRATILVATDVAARGIDVPDLTHVVNFALPQDPETYTHRIGRTGRAGKEGVAVTLIASHEYRRLMFIARSIGVYMEKARLPKIEDVIVAKREQLFTQLEATLEEGGHESYTQLAAKLIDGREAVDVVAALLRAHHGATLEPQSYREIREISGPASNNRPGGQPGFKPGGYAGGPASSGGRVLLKAQLGRSHGMTPRKLVDYLCHASRVRPFTIQNVKIHGTHSTFTAPPRESESILRAVNRAAKGAPIICRGE